MLLNIDDPHDRETLYGLMNGYRAVLRGVRSSLEGRESAVEIERDELLRLVQWMNRVLAEVNRALDEGQRVEVRLTAIEGKARRRSSKPRGKLSLVAGGDG